MGTNLVKSMGLHPYEAPVSIITSTPSNSGQCNRGMESRTEEEEGDAIRITVEYCIKCHQRRAAKFHLKICKFLKVEYRDTTKTFQLEEFLYFKS